jgi:hypothetical protein
LGQQWGGAKKAHCQLQRGKGTSGAVHRQHALWKHKHGYVFTRKACICRWHLGVNLERHPVA